MLTSHCACYYFVFNSSLKRSFLSVDTLLCSFLLLLLKHFFIQLNTVSVRRTIMGMNSFVRWDLEICYTAQRLLGGLPATLVWHTVSTSAKVFENSTLESLSGQAEKKIINKIICKNINSVYLYTFVHLWSDCMLNWLRSHFLLFLCCIFESFHHCLKFSCTLLFFILNNYFSRKVSCF